MKLHITNIGKIKEAEIAINGITVIGGENNTGKSTISKALYAIFNSFVDLESRIATERKESIRKNLSYLYRSLDLNTKVDLKEFDLDDLTNEIYNSYQINKTDYDAFVAKLTKNIDATVLNTYRNQLKRIFNVTDDDYARKMVQEFFADEFKQQINNTLEKAPGKIVLTIKNAEAKVFFTDNHVAKIEKPFSIFCEAIYLDDPFIVDKPPINTRVLFSQLASVHNYYAHKDRLSYLLYSKYSTNNLIDEIVVGERLADIMQKISRACDGKIYFEKTDELLFKQNSQDASFNIANLSTGLKTFAIIQMLLFSGVIQDGGVLLLDEPEIHLHPEWQLLFAELIVMLQKEFNLHILINTHSPYFLNAIEVYSERHKIDDKCEYYLSFNQNNESFVKCVTGNVEEIYSKLARPLQLLENLRYTDDE